MEGKPKEKNAKRLTAVLGFLALDGTPQYLRRTSLSLRLVRKLTNLTGCGRVMPPGIGAAFTAQAPTRPPEATSSQAPTGAPKDLLIVRLVNEEGQTIVQKELHYTLAHLADDDELEAGPALGQLLYSGGWAQPWRLESESHGHDNGTNAN